MSAGIPSGVASAATSDSELWVMRYDGPPNDVDDDRDAANALGVSPDGSTVFVTGGSVGSAGVADYATAAYDATTGAKRWGARYDGPSDGSDVGSDLGVSPDGSTVFVTGESDGSRGYSDYATIAYDAATGARSWVKRYDGPTNDSDDANALVVSPDGSTVFVTGGSDRSTGRPAMRTIASDYATIAYDAVTGARLWATRYDSPSSGDDWANALAVSPDGSTVFVTGQSWRSTGWDYTTVAYDAAIGATLWARRYDGGANVYPYDFANALGVSPDGATVFVTGRSRGQGSLDDAATVAYDAATGARRWARRYDGPSSRDDWADDLGVSPDGATVFVTGGSDGSAGPSDYVTVTYDAATGARRWVRRYDGPPSGDDWADALGVSPDGATVFVTGRSRGPGSLDDAATVAYDAATGARRWVRRYDGPPSGDDWANALAVSPDGATVFVTGGSDGSAGESDYATVAYAA